MSARDRPWPDSAVKESESSLQTPAQNVKPRSSEGFWWVSAVLLLAALRVAVPGSDELTLVCLALLGSLHATRAFWQSGGATITPTGVYMIASTVFVYFPALYTTYVYKLYDVANGFSVLVIIALSQMIFYNAFWKRRNKNQEFERVKRLPLPIATFGFFLGLGLLIGGVSLGRLLELGSTSLVGAAAFTGVVVLSVSIFHAGERPGLLRSVVVAIAFGFYVQGMFTGGGRLVLGGLAVALAVVVSQTARSRWVKLATVLGLPLGLLVLALNRSQLVASTRGADETGLESVVSPFARMGQLLALAHDHELALSLGRTFLATAVIFVPRSFWPEKPVGLGAELGDLFRPDLIGTGYSEAALFAGEWVINFGLLGLLVMIPLTVLLVIRADSWQNWLQARNVSSKSSFVAVCACVIITAGILDLFWGGTFLFAARSGQRLLVLALVYFAFGLFLNWSGRPKIAGQLRRRSSR